MTPLNVFKRKPYIVEYHEAIENGYIDINGERVPFLVGWKIRKVIEVLMSYFEDERIIFNPTHAYMRMDFQETFCLQGYAPFYNKPLDLMLWQKVIWEATYGFYDKATGFRLISEVLIEVARKNGKSTMIAGDADTDLFVGEETSEGGFTIACTSNDDRQAKFIWKECAGMRSRLDTKNEITKHNLTDITNFKKNINIIRLSSKTQNKDGFNFVKAYHDEAHDCKDDEIAEACQRAMSTHDERLFITVSTNGFLNNLYFDKKLDYANKWLKGEIENIHYLPFLFEQDSEDEVFAGDRNLWQKANPSLIYGVKKWAYIEENIIKAQVDRESRMHLLTKDFNIKVSNAQAWLELSDYDYKQEQFTLSDFKDCACIGAVDLSDCGDLTVAEALFMKKDDPVKYVVPQFFIPESKLEDKDNGAKYKEWSKTINPQTGEPYIKVCSGNKINQKEVADWFLMLRNKYGIYTYMAGYDKWHSDVFLLWCGKKTGYDINTMPIIQHPKVMSFPMKMVERDLQARLINYGNNPVMKMCFANTSAKIVNDRIMPEKIEGQYNRKIDGTVALIILYATLEKNEADFERYKK